MKPETGETVSTPPQVSVRHRLDLEDFVLLLGTSIGQIPLECRRLIDELNFHYTVLDAGSRDTIILQILKTLDSDLPVSGRSRLDRWEEGWSENLCLFISSNYDTKELVPLYYRAGKRVMRLSGNYVLPEDSDFETNFLAVLMTWIGRTFLRDVDHVYEFGCGPAQNLVAFAKLFPEKCYYGLDWAVASQDIIKAIAESHSINIVGHRFDMFSPDEGWRIEAKSAVITIGGMEQLGLEFEEFLQYLLKQCPQICIHTEPIYELYDQSCLFDYLAAKYSEKREYLRGYLTRLKGLEEAGQIKILHVKKNLGSLYHDGWTTVVWKPC